jgi:hypothetical protein
MKFLIIGDKSDTLNEEEQMNIQQLREGLQHKKKVFLFTFMNTCGPCINTKPNWDQTLNQLNKKYSDDDDFVVARVNYKFLDQLGNTGPEPSGYPSLRYINNGVEEYEDSGLPSSDRSTESFVQWITSKIEKEEKKAMHHRIPFSKSSNNKSKRSSKTKKHSSPLSMLLGGTRRRRRFIGGKWSMKYKKSINCRRPKGFSQRQHCKYGRGKKTRSL